MITKTKGKGAADKGGNEGRTGYEYKHEPIIPQNTRRRSRRVFSFPSSCCYFSKLSITVWKVENEAAPGIIWVPMINEGVALMPNFCPSARSLFACAS